MHALIVYGTPEDQIKVEGEFNEEFSLDELEVNAYLAINDGTLLSVNRDEDSNWKFEAITLGAATEIERVEGTAKTGTDKVSLANPQVEFQWILAGSNLVGLR